MLSFDFRSGLSVHVPVPRYACDVIAFIDNKCTATCRPGSGPAHDGPGTPRKDLGGLIQVSVYSGWKKLNGFKIETVTSPDGMTMHALNLGCCEGTTMQLLPGEGELCCIQDLQIYKCLIKYI